MRSRPTPASTCLSGSSWWANRVGQGAFLKWVALIGWIGAFPFPWNWLGSFALDFVTTLVLFLAFSFIPIFGIYLAYLFCWITLLIMPVSGVPAIFAAIAALGGAWLAERITARRMREDLPSFMPLYAAGFLTTGLAKVFIEITPAMIKVVE